MPTFQAQSPDGKLFEIDAPDAKTATAIFQQRVAQKPFDPVGEMGDISRGIRRGMRDPIDAGAELLTHGLESLAPEGSWFQRYMAGQRTLVDKLNHEGELDYTQNKGRTSDVGRVAGNALTTAPIAAAMPGATAEALGTRVLSGIGSGALTGALEPAGGGTRPEDFWSRKAEQAGAGAVGGAVAAPLVGGAARVIQPETSEAAKKLMAEGVKLTPGQIAGGATGRIEEGLQSVPFLGDIIRSSRRDALETFDRAAINRALTPIGEKLGDKTAIGRDAISEAHDKVTGAYDTLLPQLRPQADPQFTNNLATLVANAKYLEPGQDLQLRNVVRDKLLRHFSPGGGMTGEGFKEAESEIGRLARDYSTSSVASERQLGGALTQLQAELREMLLRSNPAHADELRNINTAYANLLRVQGAGGRTGAEEGVFTPSQLAASVRSLDPSMRKGSFARGDALMQDLSDAGKSVLGSKVPDSGTPFRTYLSLPAVLAGAHMDPSGISLLPAYAAAGIGAAYTAPGRKLAEVLLSQRPKIAEPIADALRRQPFTTPLAAILAQPAASP